MENSNDKMEKSRLRINRLRKLAEQIKIEEQEYYEKYGDDNLKIVLVKNSKMKFERYDDRKIPLLPPSRIKHHVFKYFIEGGVGRIDAHCVMDTTLFYKKFKNLIQVHFKNEDYVTVVSNKNERNLDQDRVIFEAFSREKKGRLTYTENKDEMKVEFMLNKHRKVNKGIIEVTNKLCYLDQLVYLGSPIEGENVLLLGDEFGMDDNIGNLLIELKPKSILNIINNDKYSWFDNVD